MESKRKLLENHQFKLKLKIILKTYWILILTPMSSTSSSAPSSKSANATANVDDLLDLFGSNSISNNTPF